VDGLSTEFSRALGARKAFETLQLNLYRLNFDLTLMEALRKVSDLSLPQ
jgi:hypothetical protein